VAACGGRAFAVLPDGTVPTPPGGPRDTGTVRRWPVVDALGLAQRCPASELLPEPPHRAVVLTVPQLLDTVLRRALAAGVDTTLLTVGVSRLYPAGPNPVPPVETVLVLLSGAQDVGAQDAGAGDLQALPSVLLRALAELPRTFVCRRATPWDRLLVDLRMRLPIADMHLGPTVPEDELWLLPDPAQSPPLRLGVTGRPVPLPLVPDGADSGVPDPGTPDFEILSGGVDSSEQRSWPKPGAEPLRVVPGRSPAARAADTRTAGVLLDDGQLDLLRRYLPGRPLAERAFLVLGDGAHLLIEATELIASLPFGVPLNRLGPGACLIEAGHVLTPPLPPAARIRTFGLTDNSVTVCCPQGFLRFDLAHLVPAWALWAPPQLPAVPSALSVEAERILEAAAAILGIAEAGGAGTARITVIDPSVLLQDAARLRAQGRFAEAAAAFRQAGEMLEAGRLFEQAAFQAPVDP
jgi:hypothetical protein